MSHAGYVAAGYLVMFGGLAAYATSIIWRGRRLSRRVSPEERRWM